MADIPTWVQDALADVYDPGCREKGISVVDMGLIRSVHVDDGRAKVELLLTSGWCPFAAKVLTEVEQKIRTAPGVTDADVEIVWDEAWIVYGSEAPIFTPSGPCARSWTSRSPRTCVPATAIRS